MFVGKLTIENTVMHIKIICLVANKSKKQQDLAQFN